MSLKLFRPFVAAGLAALFAFGCSGNPEVKDIAPDRRFVGSKTLQGALDLRAVSEGARILGAIEEAPGPAGGMIGLSLAFGDFNGDGKEDLAVGSPNLPGISAELNAPSGPGGVYLLYGGSSLQTLNDLSTLADLVLVAGKASAGYSVAFGDLNGDGLDDLIVGAPWAAGFVPLRRKLEGEVAIVFGRKGFRGTHSLSETAGVLISGARRNDFAGASFGAGDFNGDGLEDLLVGVPLDVALGTFERANAGAAYLILGRRQWPKTIDLAEEASAIFLGVAKTDRTGTAVALADVTGDGLSDAIIGAPLADWVEDKDVGQPSRDTGAVYIVKGRKEELPERVDLATESDSTIYGTESGDGAGWSIATGDFNGDGKTDLAIGAPLARHKNVRRKGDIYDLIGGNTRADLGLSASRKRVSGHTEGEVYLLWGKADWPAQLHLASMANVTLYGPPFEESEEVFILPQGGGDTGYAVAMGDVNGDGRGDLIVGSPFADGSEPYRRDSGQVHVVLGTDKLRGTSALTRLSSHLMVGSKERYRLGAVLAAGDFDGDGKDEIAVTEPRAPDLNSESSVRGRVYLIERLPEGIKEWRAKDKKRTLRKPALP